MAFRPKTGLLFLCAFALAGPASSQETSSPEAASLAAGSIFDGGFAWEDYSLGTEDLSLDLEILNETPAAIRVEYLPWKLEIELGQLGVDSRNSLMRKSPYINLIKRWDSRPDAWIDHSGGAQLGLIKLNARYFGDPPESELDRAFDLGSGLGIPEDAVSFARDQVTYDDPYRTDDIWIGSLLTQVGRAYPLFGPVDVGWTVGNLTKVAQIFPNTAFDESVGARVRLGEGNFLGLVGGVSENLSLGSSKLLMDLFREEPEETRLYVETAPHAGAALWGKMPYLQNTGYAVSGSRQWNEETTLDTVQGSLSTTFLRRPLRLTGEYSRESGPEIEFEREKRGAELTYGLSSRLAAFVRYHHEDIKFGNVEVEADTAMTGLHGILDGSGSSVTLDHVFGGGDRISAPFGPHSADLAHTVDTALTQAVKIVDLAQKLYGDIRGDISAAELQARLDELSRALAALDPRALEAFLDRIHNAPDRFPLSDVQKRFLTHLIERTLSDASERAEELRAAIIASLGEAAGDTERIQELIDDILGPVDGASAYYARHREEVLELIGILGDPMTWDAAAVQFARREAIEYANDMEIPLGGLGSMKVSPALVLAAGQILGSRLSPLSPITASDQRELVEPWLRRQAAEELGLDPLSSDEQIIHGIFGLLQDRMRAELERLWDSGMDSLGGSPPANGAEVADMLRGILPPSVLDELFARYGDDLSGLIPPDMELDDLRELLLTRLPEEVVRELEDEFGDDLTGLLAWATGWAADFIRREVNLALIQILLASEQLNRLTIDKGKTPGDLSARMIMSSFSKLDRRRQPDVRRALLRVAEKIAEEVEKRDAELAEKLTRYGEARLEALHAGEGWPGSLRLQVEEGCWPALLSLYGDKAFFEMLERLEDTYKLIYPREPLTVRFRHEYGGPMDGIEGPMRTGTPEYLEMTLPTPRRRSPAMILARLHEFILDRTPD